MPSLLGRARSIVLLLYLVAAIIVACLAVVFPAAILLLPFSRRAYRVVVGRAQWAWLALAAALLEHLAQMEVRVYGDVPDASESVVVYICNHNCRLDWMFLWPLFARHGKLSTLKIAMKASLRPVPFFGWAFQALSWLFLERNDREGDLTRIMRSLDHAVLHHGDSVALLIFPEGTDLKPDAVRSSNEHAMDKGLPAYAHVLHPRTAGFVASVEALGHRLDAIYDLTISYDVPPLIGLSSDPRPNEKYILRGMWPTVAHMDVARFPATALPQSSDELRQWLVDRWAAKEEALASRGHPASCDTGAYATITRVAVYILVTVGWAIAVWACGRAVGSPFVQLYSLLGCVSFVAFTAAGGLDQLEMRRHKREGQVGAPGTRGHEDLY